jgi:transcriptional regulator with XRE-family HTH domain
MGTKIERLEEIRVELGLNKTEFATSMGITNRYYYNILSGEGSSNLRLEHLEHLLISLKVNPAWVLTGQGEKFLKGKEANNEWIAREAFPDQPQEQPIDHDDLNYMISAIIHETGLPMLTSDLAYAVAVRYSKYYMSKYPGATRATLDIPSLTAGFLTSLHTIHSLLNATFELQPGDTVQVHFGGKTYNFQGSAQPDI